MGDQVKRSIVIKAIAFPVIVLLSIGCVSTQGQLRQHPRYTLHPGDILEISYRYTPDFNQTVAVEPDGYLSLNVVGSIRVADLTLDEAHDVIQKKAAERLNAPEISLVLKEFQQSYVVVAGQVQKPGKLPMQQATTALQAILLAGGFTEDAQAGQVLLFRKIDSQNAEVRVLKLDKIKGRIGLEHDMLLESGDMILVQRDKMSTIGRYIKLSNVGVYFNPLSMVP